MIQVTLPALPPVAVNCKHTVTGLVQPIILDRHQRPIWRGPIQKNLILNNGLDQWCNTTAFGAIAKWCVAGSGSTDTSADSGTTTAAKVGTTVTLVGGSYVFTSTAVDAGKMIKWDTGEEARIVTVTSPTVVEVTPSAAVAAAEFAVYNTQQVGLVTEVKRTNTYLTGAGNTETTYPGVTMQNRRTYDFTAEVGSVTYNELGISWSATVANNLFSRVKLASPVSLVAGQSLRVIWDLIASFSPLCTAPLVVNPSPITGWATATGDLALVHPNGLTDISDATNNAGLDPSVVDKAYYTKSWTSFTWPAWKSQPGGTPGAVGGPTGLTANVYSALDFYRTHTGTMAVGVGNASNILVIQNFSTGKSAPSLFYLMGAAQTKDSLHTLTVAFRFSVGRTLA